MEQYLEQWEKILCTDPCKRFESILYEFKRLLPSTHQVLDIDLTINPPKDFAEMINRASRFGANIALHSDRIKRKNKGKGTRTPPTI